MSTQPTVATDEFSQRISQALAKLGAEHKPGRNGKRPSSNASVATPNDAGPAVNAAAAGGLGPVGDEPAAAGPTAAVATSSSPGPAKPQARDDQSEQTEQSVVDGPGPVGGGEHLVRQGECITSIARNCGHFWETIWNDPGNAELREVRKDRSVLLPGDRVHVPPLRQKSELGQAEMRHRFQRKGQSEVFRVRVLRDGEPRGNQPYTLDVDGKQRQGTTDADGKLNCPIAGNARTARLVVGPADDADEYTFRLGAIDPLEELSGVQGRLNNLGFDCGPADGKFGPHTEKALKLYQARRRLTVTGQPDQATKQKLLEDYGC